MITITLRCIVVMWPVNKDLPQFIKLVFLVGRHVLKAQHTNAL